MEPESASALPSYTATRVPSRETGSPLVDQFSLVQGGLIYRFQAAIHMAMPDRSGILKRALLTTLITWFPLLLLSTLQGGALGPQVQIPFLHDFGVNIRFLIGLPLLVIAEAVIDPKLNRAVRHFTISGLVDSEHLPGFEDVILKTNKLRNRIFPALLILLAAFVPSIWYRETELLRHGVSSWHNIASPFGGSLSLAGWWFGFISLPLYRVLLFRWIWIVLLWTVFLRRVARIDLRCVATHPDGCGGLGFLAQAQLFFGFIGFAASAVMAGALGNVIAYEGASISSLKFLVIAFCVLIVAVFATPLLALTPKLAMVKRKGVYGYGALGTKYVGDFDAKWIHGHPSDREQLLGTADIQSLADLRNSFSVVEEMRVVLIDRRTLVGLAIPAILPMLLLIMIATPADQIIRAVLKLLL